MSDAAPTRQPNERAVTTVLAVCLTGCAVYIAWMLLTSTSTADAWRLLTIRGSAWLRPPYAGAFTPWSVLAVATSFWLVQHRGRRAPSVALFIIASVLLASTDWAIVLGRAPLPGWSVLAAGPVVGGALLSAWAAWRLRSWPALVLMMLAVLVSAAPWLRLSSGTPPVVASAADAARFVPAWFPQVVVGVSAVGVAAASRLGRPARRAAGGDDAPPNRDRDR